MGGRKKLTIENLQKEAEKFGGKLLSTNYKNNKTPILWQCSDGHQWKANANSVKRGSWCPHCRSTRLSIDTALSLAQKHEGKLLSTTYNNNKEYLEWQCKKGHTWFAPLHSVKRGFWCARCCRINIEELQILAQKYGGRLLCTEQEYKNSQIPIKWQCAKGHTWLARANNIRHANQWCPKCRKSFGEEVCRELFQIVYKEPFETVRPKWLLSPKNRPMELDGFCKKINIAFEYNGPYHYDKAPNQYRKICDNLKIDLCKKQGVQLVVIKANDSYPDDQFCLENIKKQMLLQTNVNEEVFHNLDVDMNKIRLKLYQKT